MRNKVRAFRRQQKLTQRQLAERAGTSQQQIQRIEAGKIATGLATATAIAAALGKPFEAVFPDASKALADLREQIHRNRGYSEDDLERVCATGVEADPVEWSIQLHLKGYAVPVAFDIAPAEKRRLFQLIQSEQYDAESMTFVVFDSGTRRIAVNLAEVTACQFLMEPVGFQRPHVGVEGHSKQVENAEDADSYSDHLVLLPVGGGAPLRFSVCDDVPDSDGLGRLGNLFYYLELSPSLGDRWLITDGDGEDFFIRAGNVALLDVPLDCISEGTPNGGEPD